MNINLEKPRTAQQEFNLKTSLKKLGNSLNLATIS
jgi:hypothetical protein